MGPSLLFDKSFIEGLSENEAIWLDNFFICNIVPTFFVEALADLTKINKSGRVKRTPEEIVKDIALKVPLISSCPNILYDRLVISNLLGQEVEMDGRPIISGGEYKKNPEGKITVSYERFPEAEALERWKKEEFLEVERSFASSWRASLSSISFDSKVSLIKNIVPENTNLSSMENVKIFAENFVGGNNKELIQLAFEILNIPDRAKNAVFERWLKEDKPNLLEFAPYAAFVFKIYIFFYLCLMKSFISKERASNLVDISYLFYLPFCNVFVSSDKLHLRTTNLFMSDNQTLISGSILKDDLKKIDNYFLKIPEEAKKRGVLSFAHYPPDDIETEIGIIRDKYLIPWRESAKKFRLNGYLEVRNKESDKELLEFFKKEREKEVKYEGPPLSSDSTDSLLIKRKIRNYRGSWQMVSDEIAKKANKGNVD